MIRAIKITVTALLLGAFGLMHVESAHAFNGYITDHMTRVSTVTGSILFMLDVGPPPSCAGVAYGWMLVNETTGKSMAALVLGPDPHLTGASRRPR